MLELFYLGLQIGERLINFGFQLRVFLGDSNRYLAIQALARNRCNFPALCELFCVLISRAGSPEQGNIDLTFVERCKYRVLFAEVVAVVARLIGEYNMRRGPVQHTNALAFQIFHAAE